uniref:Small integral membrane protein 15 n=1 Tax=Nomascus leucogenys TaxID=61853 RepID=G1QR85_NOMLE
RSGGEWGVGSEPVGRGRGSWWLQLPWFSPGVQQKRRRRKVWLGQPSIPQDPGLCATRGPRLPRPRGRSGRGLLGSAAPIGQLYRI